jgi:asparagine synthase (glutamine-hydrolysing)
VSAIAGIFWLDGSPVASDGVPRLLRALAHRGPDGSSSWCAGPVGLGHLLFRTTSQASGETQPLTDPLTGVVLVADARIDNAPGSASDGAQILRTYREHARDCVDHLVGDFALALWDPRHEHLFLARDPMGVKPLYYYHTPRLFAFATEIKALLALPAVPRVVDEDQMRQYAGLGLRDREGTFFKGIRRLPAAHTLTVTPQGVELRRYWSPEATGALGLKTDADYAGAFRELFREAVRVRLRSTGPVGASLSGGLDSSSVVCTARDLINGAGPLHTFSLVFPSFDGRAQRQIDEREYMDAVVAGGRVQPHFVRGDELSPLGDLERVLWHLDEPFGAPNLYLHWGMYRAAQQSGVRVFLDGFDGDSAVSHGLSRLNDLGRAGQWDAFEAEVRAFARHRGIEPGAVLPHFGLPLLVDFARRGRWLKWARGARQLARRFGLGRRDLLIRYGLAPLWRRDGDKPPLGERAAHVAGLSQPLYQESLEIADQSAAAFGVEARYPFFDQRLIEFCLAVPPERKFADGWTRLTMRRAMQGVLPPAVQWRATKANLSPNFLAQIRAQDGIAANDGDVQLAFRQKILSTWLASASHLGVDRPDARPVHGGPHTVRARPLVERRAHAAGKSTTVGVAGSA